MLHNNIIIIFLLFCSLLRSQINPNVDFKSDEQRLEYLLDSCAILLNNNSFDIALNISDQCISLCGNRKNSYLTTAKLIKSKTLLELSRLDESEEELLEVIDILNEFPDAYLDNNNQLIAYHILGLVRKEKGNFLSAEYYFRRCIEDNLNYFNKGEIYYELGRLYNDLSIMMML